MLTQGCWRWKRKGWCCAAGSRRRAAAPPARRQRRARVVRSRPARPHPPLHAQSAPREIEPVSAGRLHAVPVHVASRRRPAPGCRASTACARRSRSSTASSCRPAAWERSVLPARLDRYDPSLARHAVPRRRSGLGAAVAGRRCPKLGPSTPVALFLREHARRMAHAARAGATGRCRSSAGRRGQAGAGAIAAEAARRSSAIWRARCRSTPSGSRARDRAAGRRRPGRRRTASPVCAALIAAAKGRPARPAAGTHFAGRWTAVAPVAVTTPAGDASKRRSSSRRARCSGATASCSAAC